MADLPKLTDKRQKFVILYIANCFENPYKCYKESFDCSNMNDNSIQVEASRLLKDPKVSLWIELAKKNCEQVFKDEIKYSAKDCFDEIETIKNIALESYDKNGNPNANTALKAIELKGKLAGHFIDKHQVTGGGLADVLDRLK